MIEASPKDTKRVLCTKLTSVVRSSALKDSIDAKAFFMMLNTNFPALFQGGRFDLGPLWEALSPGRSPEVLYSLFLKFEEEGSGLGVEMQLPNDVEILPSEKRQAFLELFGIEVLDPSALTPFPEITTDPDIQIPHLKGESKAPVVSPDLKRRITQHVLQAIKWAPVGSKVNSGQIAYFVDSHFEELLRGDQYDFAPICQALLEVEGVRQSDILAAIAKLEDTLSPMGFSVGWPSLHPDPATHEVLVRDARLRANATTDERAETPSPRVVEAKAQTGKNEAKGAKRTKRRGLTTWGFDRNAGKRSSRLRLIVMAVVFLGAGLFFWLERPNRPLNLNTYRTIFPLSAVELRLGFFTGVLHEPTWYALTKDGRVQALKGLTDELRRRGLILNMQIVDSQGRVVVTNAGPGKLVGAKLIMQSPTRDAQPAPDPLAPDPLRMPGAK